MLIDAIKAQAKKEIEEEDFRRAVDWAKLELRLKKPWWKKIFPWKITIKITRTT